MDQRLAWPHTGTKASSSLWAAPGSAPANTPARTPTATYVHGPHQRSSLSRRSFIPSRLPTRVKADGTAAAATAPSVPLPGSASASEVRVWLSGLVDDLLAALPLPEWPGAGVLLRRLVLAIGSSSKEWQGWLLHADMGVRGVCVELLGAVARALCALGREVEAPEVAREVARMVEEAAGGRLWGVCGVRGAGRALADLEGWGTVTGGCRDVRQHVSLR